MDDTFRACRQRNHVALFGAVDESSVDSLREVLAGYPRDQHLTVDLSDLTHLASVGISVLVATHLRLQSGGSVLTLRARQGTIAQQVLKICAIPHDAMDTVPS